MFESTKCFPSFLHLFLTFNFHIFSFISIKIKYFCGSWNCEQYLYGFAVIFIFRFMSAGDESVLFNVSHFSEALKILSKY